MYIHHTCTCMWCCLLLYLYVYSIRSHTPDVTSSSKPPELPAYRKHSPPAVSRRGSPGVSRQQLAVDNSTPPTLPPKKNQQVEYAEVPVSFINIHNTTGNIDMLFLLLQQNRTTAFAVPNGIGAIIINESKGSSYADLDWSQVNAT